MNLASATWFYTTPQPPKPSMLHVIDGTWQPNEVDRRNGIVPVGRLLFINLFFSVLLYKSQDFYQSLYSLGLWHNYKHHKWWTGVQQAQWERVPSSQK